MISVITITFNNYEELVATCSSLKDQSNIEHVIINGGNCNRSKEYLDHYTPSLMKTTIVSEPDDGIYDAFNKGIINSSGDYIHFLNSGDLLINPNYYSTVKNIFDNDKNVMAVHSDIYFSDTLAGNIRIKPTFKNLGRGLNFNHPTFICKKIAFDQIGLFNKNFRYAGDFDWAVKFTQNNFKSVYLPEVSVKMDGAGVSTTQEYSSIKECYRALKTNNELTLANRSSYLIRVLGYFLRRGLNLVGLGAIVSTLKKMKHRL